VKHSELIKKCRANQLAHPSHFQYLSKGYKLKKG